jgi:hypothetical protein
MLTDGLTGTTNTGLNYLLEIYKLYQGHINTMLNYFLIVAGLFANAYIQVLQKDPMLSAFVAFFGAVMSIICLCVHIRSRQLLDVIEMGLEAQERNLFSSDSPGFLLTRARPRHWFLRHRWQFRILYSVVVIGFFVMMIYALYRNFR